MTTPTLQQIIDHVRPNVHTSNGTAHVSVGVMPDEAIAEIFDDVAAAKATFDEIDAKAAELRATLNKATTARREHKDKEEAVYTFDPNLGIVFSDAEGVRLQNAVKAADKALATNAAKAKNALMKYVAVAALRRPDAADEFTRRAVEANVEAQRLAEALTTALTERERYWTLAGKPVRASAEATPAIQTQRSAEQGQYLVDLKHLLSKALPFVSL